MWERGKRNKEKMWDDHKLINCDFRKWGKNNVEGDKLLKG